MQNIENSLIDDAVIGKHLILVTLGIYSFYFMNFQLETDKYNDIVYYLKKYVILFVEPNIFKLKSYLHLNKNDYDVYLRVSHFVLGVCHAFCGNTRKYLKYWPTIKSVCINTENSSSLPKLAIDQIIQILKQQLAIVRIHLNRTQIHGDDSDYRLQFKKDVISKYRAKTVVALKILMQKIKDTSRCQASQISFANAKQYHN